RTATGPRPARYHPDHARGAGGACQALCRRHARRGDARGRRARAVGHDGASRGRAARLLAGARAARRGHPPGGGAAARLHPRRRTARHDRGDHRARGRVTLLDRLTAIAASRRAEASELALLLDALGAPTKAEQRRAAEALAAVAGAGQDVQPVLEQGLADGSSRRRWGAAYACSLVGVMPAACLPVLLEALGSDDGDGRWAAATIVRSFPAGLAIVAELRALARAPSPLHRKMALYCLRDLAARVDGLEAELVVALRDAEPAVRLAAMSAVTALAEDRAAAA